MEKYILMIKELVEHIVKQLVNDPDQVGISITQDGNKSTVEIRVSDRDRGRLIGKNGRTIKAVRTIVDVVVPVNQKILVNIAPK
ncbi:MAG: KH domain-containing protein [bacterium]|nr:KH domain-containing protein [bacterium]